MMLVPAAAWSQQTANVVLITHKSSNVDSLSLLDIRRLYLGFSVANKNVNRPVINRVNEKVYEDFLKNIMHMTEDGYKRKIVRRVFRYGADYVTELYSIVAIARHLDAHPNDVVFVATDDLPRIKGAKIVVRLW